MTNRVIKDYHRNKLVLDIYTDTMKILSITLLSLHKYYPKQFYTLNVQKWLEGHEEWCEMMNEYEANDAYEYKMQDFCERYGVDDKAAMTIAKKHCNEYSKENMRVLTENVKLALIHTACDFGFGKIRLGRIVKALLEEDFPNWKDDIFKFGISVESELKNIDYRKLKPSKKKAPTVQEQKEAAEKLAEFKAYFDYIMSKEEES